MMKKYALTIGVGVVCAVVFFFVGRATIGGSASVTAGSNSGFNSSTRPVAAGHLGNGLVMGQIIAKDAQSITIQLANGNSENVYYSSSTQIMKLQPIGVSALASGTRVIIGGTTDSSGNMTATGIQIQTNVGPLGNRGPQGQ